MSASIFSDETAGRAGSRPWAAGLRNAMGGPVGHMLDLALFLPFGVTGWTDAMVSETRRHLAGCIGAIERDFLESLSAAAGIAMPVAEDAIAWPGVQRHFQLIGPELIAHMRIRAAVGLLARKTGAADEGHGIAAEADLGWLQQDADPAVSRRAVLLASAEQRWAIAGGEDSPMRPDLPAEHFADLVWSVASLHCAALGRRRQVTAAAAVRLVTDVAQAQIARHDEAAGPLALAVLLARLLRDWPDQPRLLGLALAQRRLPLFAALAAERTGITAEAILHALVHEPPPKIAALAHALGGSASDCRHLLVELQPLRNDLGDAAIIALAADFERLTTEEAEAAIAGLRGPAELRAKLALVEPAA